MRMRFFGGLHPAVSFLYFAAVLALTLVCFHPVMAALSLTGAVCFSAQLNGWRSVGLTSRFVLPMFLLIAIANPLFNHRGVTMLCMLFDQWFTLEAVCYGLVSAASLSAVIFWFTCYQAVMTSDKFLFLFGQIAPNTALLITMTLGLILARAGICVLGRVFGHGTMEFYPRMDAVFTGVSGAVLYIAFAVLALFPSILEMKEKLTWRCCGLTD